jgi:DNA-directed RNA polymerase subunit RPC12/RpoP
MDEDLRCPHCRVIILLKERAASGIPVPTHCPMCGEKVELQAAASRNVPSNTQRREPRRP